MKILKYILLVFLSIAGGALLLGLFVNGKYAVNRSIKIDRSKAIVMPFIADFNTFDRWSPWAELDPEMVVEIKGKPATIGHSYYWNGNEEAGEGSMTITQISTDQIDVELKFIRPFESISPNSYIIEQGISGTDVSWTMSGEMPYPFNLMMLFMNMEEEIGKDFDKGLLQLKKVIEEEFVEEPVIIDQIEKLDDAKSYFN